MAFDELGLYFYLLCRSWIEGGIPSSLDEISRYAKARGIPRNKLERMWKAISPCWVTADPSGATLVNPRLEIERQAVGKYWDGKSRAGKASAARAKAEREASGSRGEAEGRAREPATFESESDANIRKVKENGSTHVTDMFNIPGNNIDLDLDVRHQTETLSPNYPENLPAEIDRLCREWRKVRDRRLAEEILTELPGDAWHLISVNFKAWCDYWLEMGWNFAPSLAAWLKDKGYEAPPPPVKGGQSRDREMERIPYVDPTTKRP